MSIADEISRILQAKADIKIAIEGKGVTVSGSATLDDYDDYIDAIQQGSTPNLQTKSVTPTESAQVITADTGYDGLEEVDVAAISSSYVGSGITRRDDTDLSASGATVTVPSGYYADTETKSVASGSVTAPASISGTSATVSTGTNTMTFTKTISVTPNVTTAGYVSSGTAGNSSVSLTANVNTRSSSDLSASGDTVTVPAGYYSSQATKAVSEGTAGTPTATKGTVSNHSVTVTPSVTNTTGYITGGTKTGTGVSVSASELVSGNKEITSNGTGIDVSTYSTCSVSVPTPSPTLITKSITQNGTYNASSDNADGYSSVSVNVSGGGSSYTLVTSQEFTVNTSSTSWVDVGTISAGSSVYTGNKLLYIKIRDKAGHRTNYYYGCDIFAANSNAANGSTNQLSIYGILAYRVNSSGNNSHVATSYGVCLDTVKSNGDIKFKARYSSSSSGTINGTFKVDVYLLDWPNNETPFAVV